MGRLGHRLATVRDPAGSVVGALTVDEAGVRRPAGRSWRGDVAQALPRCSRPRPRHTRAELDAITDGLTGLYNHRYLHERLAKKSTAPARTAGPSRFCSVGLDQFKSFNDSLGHRAGDEALCRMARAIEKSTRRIDLAARYGGDEFVVALLGSDAEAAVVVAERLRETIADDTSSHDPVTVSIGTATYPTDAVGKAELLEKADLAMYEAKRAGRDRVVAFNGEIGPTGGDGASPEAGGGQESGCKREVGEAPRPEPAVTAARTGRR